MTKEKSRKAEGEGYAGKVEGNIQTINDMKFFLDKKFDFRGYKHFKGGGKGQRHRGQRSQDHRRYLSLAKDIYNQNIRDRKERKKKRRMLRRKR